MKILKHFIGMDELPISIDEVADFILSSGYVERITYVAEVPENDAFIGMLVNRRYKPPYAHGEYTHAHVMYNPDLPENMERIVCAKELIHITETSHDAATTRADVDRLLYDLSLPGPIREEMIAFAPGWTDRTGLLRAAALLAPYPIVQIAKEAIEKDKFSVNQFASLALIPTPFAKLVLSDEWPELLRKMNCPLSKN